MKTYTRSLWYGMAVGVALTAAAGRAADPPPALMHETMGVDLTTYFNNQGRFTLTMANDITNAGIRWVRNNFRRRTTVDEIDYASFDLIVSRARDRGINLMGLIGTDSKAWSSTLDWQNVSWQMTFSNRVMEIVGRYHNDIRFWEIWNEPNSMSGIPAAQYGQILAMCYHAIKTYYPECSVLHAGLSWAWNDARNYLIGVYNSTAFQSYYAAHQRYPFDIMAVHPYAWTHDPDTYLAQQLNDFKAAMNARGDGWKRFWLTELGWSNTDSTLGLNKGSQAANDYYQALYLLKAYQIISTNVDPVHPEYGPYVDKMFWFAYEDNPYEDADLGLRDFSGFIVTELGAAKQNYFAYRDMARASYRNLSLRAVQMEANSSVAPAMTVTQAIDDSAVTLWQSAGSTGVHALTHDVGAQAALRGCTILHAGCAGYTATYNSTAMTLLAGAGMAGPWQTLTTIVNAARAPMTHVEFAGVTARYVRLQINAADAGPDGKARVAEWRVLGLPLAAPTLAVFADDFNDTWVNHTLWERQPPTGYSEPQFLLLYETNAALYLCATGAWFGPAVASYIACSGVQITAQVTVKDTSMLPGGNEEAHCGLAFNCNGAYEYHLNFFAHDGTPDTPNIRLRRSGDWTTVGTCRTNVAISAGDTFGVRITTGYPQPDSLAVGVGHWPSYDNLLDWHGTDPWSLYGSIKLENWQLGACAWDSISVEQAVPEGCGVLVWLATGGLWRARHRH